jgi:hypothetical protein
MCVACHLSGLDITFQDYKSGLTLEMLSSSTLKLWKVSSAGCADRSQLRSTDRRPFGGRPAARKERHGTSVRRQLLGPPVCSPALDREGEARVVNYAFSGYVGERCGPRLFKRPPGPIGRDRPMRTTAFVGAA